MAFRIETSKVYVIGITFSTCLSDASPAKLIPLVGEWRTENAGPSERRRMHRRLGVVLHHDPVTDVAVLLLGSSRPSQPQRYIPWLGTRRLPFQTLQVLQPDGGDRIDFQNFPGYLNFSHAIRVLVVQPSSVNRSTNPGPTIITDILDRNVNPHDVINIRLPPSQLEKLKELHASYWDGVRYNADGFEQTGDDEGGQDHGSVHGQGSSEGVQGQGSSEGVQGQGSSEGVQGQGSIEGVQGQGSIEGVQGQGSIEGVQGQGSTEGVQDQGSSQGTGSLQEDTGTAEETVSVKLGRALAWEHFRNQQLSMVEGVGDEDEDTFDVETLPQCVLGVLTKKDLLSEFNTEESPIGFPWEMKIGVELES